MKSPRVHDKMQEKSGTMKKIQEKSGTMKKIQEKSGTKTKIRTFPGPGIFWSGCSLVRRYQFHCIMQ